ncbi:MAG: uracil-DNA glycosylase [Desulfuromonas sp.]|nr:MAG: uracil-DNA glycosylase [Desulfuromonas sp.]
MLGAELPGLCDCRRCSRLATYRESHPPRKGLSRADYWGKPVPGFGDSQGRVCLVGLAPGAHGANRTGRPFTGDGAGDFMYPLLHDAGFASQKEAVAADDGLVLHDLYLTNAVKCVPPENRPQTNEYIHCLDYLAQELASLPRLRVICALGRGAYDSCLRLLLQQGRIRRRGDYLFGHGAVHQIEPNLWLVASYHTSRYNIQTRRIDATMFLSLLATVRRLANGDDGENG